MSLVPDRCPLVARKPVLAAVTTVLVRNARRLMSDGCRMAAS
jgi:hypothetical protein